MVKQRQSNTKRWGTLEELLLASAVNRHGTTSWDSVAMEIHNRSSCSSSISPQDCRNKFCDLKRRFLLQEDSDSDSTSLVPMLDALRKIRVEELRRDVQRRDVLILSLEMKVKRLEEEREEGDGGPDLEGDGVKTNLRAINPTASGDESDDRENRSLNESNSTSRKDDIGQNGTVEEKQMGESVKITKMKGTGPIRTEDEPEKEWSFNGGAGEAEREKKCAGTTAAAGGRSKRREKERKAATAAGDWNEAWESVSESKQEGKEGGAVSKQQLSSDVQSSGSLSQRKRCRNSSGEEPEVSPAKPNPKHKPKPTAAAESEPFLKFLHIIRSHRLASAFERRLRSQESERYKKLIRQHIDLRTIHSRVVKGAYADSIHRFFRDLLLLFNNAIIFFQRSSPENGAALNLRALVLKEMKDRIRSPQSSVVEKSKHDQEADASSSKPTGKSSTTMVGCRKRDSVSQISDVGGGKKSEKNSRDSEGKAKGNDSSEIKIYEKGAWKKSMSMKERPRAVAVVNSGARSSRTMSSKNNGEVKHEYGGNELSSHDGIESRMGKKERVTKKKQGAVSFLKRMKQNSPSEATDEDGDSSEDESLKEEEEEEEEEVVEEKKRTTKKQNEGKRERVRPSGGGSGGGRGGGGGGRGKRGVGRPPKKAETMTVKRKQREDSSGSKPRKRLRR